MRLLTTLARGLLLIAGLALAGCNADPVTLKIIAGSEVKDLEPIFNQMKSDVGVALEITYSGTLDGVERVRGGEAFDAAWFSHGKYLKLVAPTRVLQEERIMLSPVVMGVKRSTVERLGWRGKSVTWGDIADASAAGKLRYAMTNPSASNSGFTALMGVNAALGSSNERLKGFFKGQTLTAGSSGWLAESFTRDFAKLDGMINYESVLLSLKNLPEPLELIYPKEGIVTADYPLTLLAADKRETYQKVVDYLRLPKTQERIMNDTLRRPANPDVAVSSVFPKALLVELPFPQTAPEVSAILGKYLSDQRRAVHSVFVLDISGSMDGERFEALKNSLRRLAGDDTSLSGQAAVFQKREQVTVVTFSGTVSAPETLLIQSAAERQTFRDRVDALKLGNGTAIYDGLNAAYAYLAKTVPLEPDKSHSVVLMTDGENNAGDNLAAFEAKFAALPSPAKSVKLFPILFGEANNDEMNRLAELTGGRVFDGRKSLEAAFKEIRGYQ